MRIKIALIVAVLLLLCGCGGESVDTSLRAPKLPAEFVEFNDEIDKIRNMGFELVSPNGGTNRQSVQLTDLDGDGLDEGVAFFREMGNSYKVYAYIFKKNGESYDVAAKIEGPGDTVENVTYADLLGTGNNEIVIGWSMAESGGRSITVHSVTEEDVVKLCEMPSLHHIVCDLNDDMVSDLCVIHADAVDGRQKISFYSEQDGKIVYRSSAPLSANSDTILRIRAAYSGDSRPAVFVEKRYLSSGIITDIITCKGTQLNNTTYSETDMGSSSTARIYEIFCEDIDGDGSLEVPIPNGISLLSDPVQGERMQGITWYGFENGILRKKAYTIRSNTEKWSIALPLDWEGKCIAFYHKKSAMNFTTIYSCREDGTSEELFSILALTGENREKNMEKIGVSKVLDHNGTLYAVEIKKKRYLGYDITAEMLGERFSYRESEWSTGEVVFNGG